MMKWILALIAIFVFLCFGILAGCGSEQPEDKSIYLPSRIDLNEEDKSLLLPYVVDFKMFNELNGWLVVSKQNSQNQLLKTSDGGLTWNDVSPNTEFTFPHFFLDENHVWLTKTLYGNIQVIYTSDGGKSWLDSTSYVSDAQIMGIHFLNQTYGWITNYIQGHGAGGSDIEILETIDGGENWNLLAGGESKNVISPEGHKLLALPTSLERGWITLNAMLPPWLYTSINGGEKWTKLELPVNNEMPAEGLFGTLEPVFIDNIKGLLPVYMVADQLYIVLYMTRDGGNTWAPLSLLVSPKKADGTYDVRVDIDRNMNAWISIDQEKLYLYREGIMSEIASLQQLIPSNYRILAFDLLNEKEGLIVLGDNKESRLYRTQDSGDTWEAIMSKIE